MQDVDAKFVRAPACSHNLSQCSDETERIRWHCGHVAGLDYLSYPSGVIQEAQNLAAIAFGAEQTWFLVNGTTAGMAHHTPVHIVHVSMEAKERGRPCIHPTLMAFLVMTLCVLMPNCNLPVQGYMLR